MKRSEITEALLDTGNNEFELTVVQRSVNPYYIYASVAINTNSDERPDLIRGLRDAGFELASIYSPPSPVVLNETESENPITVGVSLNAGPAVLTDAVAEYEQKYNDILAVLDKLDLTEDRIQQHRFNIYPRYSGYSPDVNNSYNDYAQVKIATPFST